MPETSLGTTKPLFHGWLRPQPLAVRGLTPTGIILAVIAYYTGVITLQAHPAAGLSMLGATAALTLIAGIRITGLSATEAATEHARWHLAVRSGSTRFAAVREGGWQPPGPFAALRTVSIPAPGAGFGAVHDPQTRRLAVTLDVTSTAAELTDAHQHDSDVQRWERWLENLGHHPEIHHVTATVHTAPAPATLLRETVQARLNSLAPLDCQYLMTTLAGTLPTTAWTTRTSLTLVFDLRAFDAQLPHRTSRKHDDLSPVLPLVEQAVAALAADLDGCGVRVTARLTETQLAARVREAYDPTTAGIAGDIDWHTAGPVRAVEHRDYYEHDSAVSACFVWSQAPRTPVPSTVLARLSEPGRFRKTITCTFHPTPAAQSMTAATRQIRSRRLQQAVARLPVIGRPATAQDDHDTAAALRAGTEVAEGAGWTSLTITAHTTVMHPDDLPAAVADLEQAAAGSQLRLRRLYRLQAAGFAASLPAGLSLPDLTRRWTR